MTVVARASLRHAHVTVSVLRPPDPLAEALREIAAVCLDDEECPRVAVFRIAKRALRESA